MAFVTVATLEQLRDGIVLKVRVAERELLIYRQGNEISVVSARCTHLHMSLPAHQEGGVVTCTFHGAEFELFVKLMREHPNIWSKVSCPERLSVTGPKALNGEQHAYQDVVPFGKRMVETFPDRVLWGTDWPHPNLKDHMPDDGLLVDFIPQIAATPELQRKLLVDNPMRLYWRT